MATAPAQTAKIVRHGEMLSIEVSAALLNEVGIDETAELRVWSDGSSLVFSPADAERDAKFKAAVADTFAKYGNMFKRLAE